MKSLLPVLSIIYFASLPLGATEGSKKPKLPEIEKARHVLTIDWEGAPNSAPGDEETEDMAILRIRKSKQNRSESNLWTMDDPPLQTRFYALLGKVRYENVDGAGYLKLTACFPDGEGDIVGTTDAGSGATAVFTRSSPWREMWLPLNAEDAERMPEKINVSLVLPSVGVVEISSLHLYEFKSAEAMNAVVNPGAPRQAGASLSNPKRRIMMAGILLTVAIGLGAMHLLHLRREQKTPVNH